MENLNWLMRYMVRKELMAEDEYQPVTQTSLFETVNSAPDNDSPVDADKGSSDP